MENEILENLCNKIVDIVHETFTKKNLFCQDLAIKKVSYISYYQKKKRERLTGDEKNALLENMFDVFWGVFKWYSDRHKFLGKN